MAFGGPGVMAWIAMKQRGSKLLLFFLARELLSKLLYLFCVMQPWKAKSGGSLFFSINQNTAQSLCLGDIIMGSLQCFKDIWIYFKSI